MLHLFTVRGISITCYSYFTRTHTQRHKLLRKTLHEYINIHSFISMCEFHHCEISIQDFNFVEFIIILFTIKPPLLHFSFQNEEISHLLMLLKTVEVSQHAMLQESTEPSMVLDRTMFNLYCSTTWLDQAQRKIPLTGRVSVRQPPKREER